MGDTNEYRNLLEPPTKEEKVNEGRRTYVIYGQCNILGHFKQHCHWNPNNKLKDKKEVAMNGVLKQHGGIRNKSNNKRGHKRTNKSNSNIYCCFIYNFVEHKIYDCHYKDKT
jgi:hypothetical protein